MPRLRTLPLVDIGTNKGGLVAIVRKLLRPNELGQLYRKAAARHGDECVGLAVGLRGAYLASNIIGVTEKRPKLTYGTKQCVAEAFSAIFPKVHATPRGKDDTIRIEDAKSKLCIQLTPKKHFKSPAEALSCPDDMLFQSIKLERK